MEFHDVIPTDLIPDLFSVRDRVCFITGAGGLGETVARAFAHNGAKIALANRSQEKADRVCRELAAEGCVCKSYALNVKDLEDCRRVTGENRRERSSVRPAFRATSITPDQRHIAPSRERTSSTPFPQLVIAAVETASIRPVSKPKRTDKTTIPVNNTVIIKFPLFYQKN